MLGEPDDASVLPAGLGRSHAREFYRFLSHTTYIQPDQGRRDDGSRRSPALGSATRLNDGDTHHVRPRILSLGEASSLLMDWHQRVGHQKRLALVSFTIGTARPRRPQSTQRATLSSRELPRVCLIDSICSRASPAAGKHQTSCCRARQPRRPPDSQ